MYTLLFDYCERDFVKYTHSPMKEQSKPGTKQGQRVRMQSRKTFLLEIDMLCTEHQSSLPFHLLWPVISSLPFLVAHLMIIGSCSLVYNYS